MRQARSQNCYWKFMPATSLSSYELNAIWLLCTDFQITGETEKKAHRHGVCHNMPSRPSPHLTRLSHPDRLSVPGEFLFSFVHINFAEITDCQTVQWVRDLLVGCESPSNINYHKYAIVSKLAHAGDAGNSIKKVTCLRSFCASPLAPPPTDPFRRIASNHLQHNTCGFV